MEWWDSHKNASVFFDTAQPELYYVWENWEEYHHGTGDVNTDDLSQWLWEDFYGYESEDSKADRHDNPLCGVEPWISTEVSCDHYNIEYKDTCYVMYSHNPCNMSEFECAIPHYDLDGNWRYDDCKAMF